MIDSIFFYGPLRKTGRRTSLFGSLSVCALVGASVGASTVLLEKYFFDPDIPRSLATAFHGIDNSARFLACFHSIADEAYSRLLFMTVACNLIEAATRVPGIVANAVEWISSSVFERRKAQGKGSVFREPAKMQDGDSSQQLGRSARKIPSWIYWAGNIVAASCIGLGKVPPMLSFVQQWAGLMEAPREIAIPALQASIVKVLLFNYLISIPAGYFFWKYGIEHAVVAHFFSDFAGLVFSRI